MSKKNSHCSFCGSAFVPNQAWPRRCGSCQKTSFINPLPVAVVLVPVDDGVLTIRRGVEPQKGQLALPGGYIDFGESWQAAGAREVMEESGIAIDPAGIRIFDVLSAPDGTVLIFGRAQPLEGASLAPFEATHETSERRILTAPEALAFPLHTQIVGRWFEGRG